MNPTFKDKCREYSHKYYMAHREELLAKMKKYQSEHKEQLNAYSREYALAHRTEAKTATAEWRNKNKEYNTLYQNVYAKRKQAFKTRNVNQAIAFDYALKQIVMARAAFMGRKTRLMV